MPTSSVAFLTQILHSWHPFSFSHLSNLRRLITMASFSSTHFSSPTTQLNSSQDNSFTLISLLKNCKSMKQLQQAHSQIIKTGLMVEPIGLLSRLISLCCVNEWGDIDYARSLFEEIPEPSLFIWNEMIRGYSQRVSPKNGVLVYLQMLRRGVRPDHYTFPFLLRSFTCEMAMKCGDGFHAHVSKFGFESDSFVQNALMNVYILCGTIDTAREYFDNSSTRNVVSWNAMISGYNKSRRFKESLTLFVDMEKEMVEPTLITLISVLSACAKLKDLETGKRVHRYVTDFQVTSNLKLENALVDMYASCGEMQIAIWLFENMADRDVITWTSLVTGFANLGQVYRAQDFFDQMPKRDYVSWTVMIDAYLKANCFKEALGIFHEMQSENIRPDEFTMVSVLTACANLGALESGEWIHIYINKNKMKKDVFVGNALIDMYSKCGKVENALKVFREMPRRDKFTWTAMIVGLAVNGNAEEALDLFSEMLKSQIVPDEVTFIGVLCACTHGGMVEKGRQFFSTMTPNHGIERNVTHYGCMVDLLGRAGNLSEALEIINKMPMKPNSIVWGSLLGACRVHRDAELAEKAAKCLLELEPENGSVYVLLANIYAACNRWEMVREVRQLMMDRGIKKIPGCSLIEMNGCVHEFVAGDRSHPRSTEIYSKLDEMAQDLKFAGYVPDMSEVFLDVGEEEKETALHQHSEKLAIAFALISSGPGVAIRIVKNLRMCVDCHQAAKLISQVYDREVIVRDRTRFHHFTQGSCSCKDYW